MDSSLSSIFSWNVKVVGDDYQKEADQYVRQLNEYFCQYARVDMCLIRIGVDLTLIRIISRKNHSVLCALCNNNAHSYFRLTKETSVSVDIGKVFNPAYKKSS